jgi:peptide/nickel transport system permease protein
VRKLKLGLTIVGLVSLTALFAPWIAQQDPRAMSLPDRLEGPSKQHWLGRDENGGDVFAKLIYGSRVSLGVAWSVVLISASLGLVVGSIAGYRGGWVDQLMMRVTDMFYAFPGFLIALALVAVLGPSVFNLVLAMCVTGWTGFARLVRGEVLHLKTRDHVQSARAVGAGAVRIITVHIWPNLISLVVIQATFGMAGTIIAEAGLSFLGLGVPGHTPTWGALLNSGRRVMAEAPHISVAPGLAIVVLVLGFNMLGDGLRDYLDPRRGVKSRAI